MGGRIDRIRLRPTTANGQPALAAYAEDEATGEHRAYGLMVFAIAGERIAGITGFPDRGGLYERLGCRWSWPRAWARGRCHRRHGCLVSWAVRRKEQS